MLPARFFRLDEATRKELGIVIFAYRGISYEKKSTVYLSIEKNYVGVFLQHPRQETHLELFRLHFSDFDKQSGKLSRTLNDLWRYAQHELELAGGELQIKKRVGSHYTSQVIFKGEVLVHSSSSICYRSILLHFLFDLQHSDIFQHSPHYDRLRTIIRENTLFQAILAKAEYWYQRDLYQKELAEEEVSSITRDYYQAAEKKWLQLLIDEESGPVIAASPWFADNLEEEVEQVLWPKPKKKFLQRLQYQLQNLPANAKNWAANWPWGSRREKIEYAKTDKDLAGAVANWYLTRYNYRFARILCQEFHSLNWFAIRTPRIMAFLILGGVCLWVLGGLQVLGILLILLTAFGCFAFGAFHAQDRPIQHLIDHLTLLNIANYFSPRLIMTLLITWMATAKFGGPDPIPFLQAAFFYLVSVTVVIVYLYRTIVQEAPDLPFEKTALRVLSVWVRVFFATLVIGTFVLTVSIWDDPLLTAEFCWSFGDTLHLYPLLLLKTAPIVFFTGLFVNLLFKDKRVTGF